MSKFNINDIADFFLSIESMTHKKLQKLCYYAQAWHLALLNKPLFNDDFQAWIHGPVNPDLYQTYKGYGWEEIPKSNLEVELNSDTLKLLKEVYRVYGNYNGDQLEHLTHKEKPWKEARGKLSKLEPSNNVIDTNLMKMYYKDVYEKNQND